MHNVTKIYHRIVKGLKYCILYAPSLMVAVAYIDPGNYSTAVAAGSAFQYKLLFSIFLSNCLAVFLQVLSARLGCVTGLDLATNCRVNLNPKLNLFIYIMAEIAIIATDLAEVVGMAIALNILFNIPLMLGVLITVIDVLIVLMAYRPKGPLLFIKMFEAFVSLLVTATVICFGVELYQVSHDSDIDFQLGEVLQGFLPNEKVIDMSERDSGNGLFLSLAILGATVMPHSLYLGSGLVQPRLKDFDLKHGYYINEYSNTSRVRFESDDFEINDEEEEEDSTIVNTDEEETDDYRPSIHAINDTMSYTIIELIISLFTVALFVNSAILIVAGATLKQKHENDDHDLMRWFRRDRHEDDDNDGYMSDSDDADYENADLFTIYHLLSKHLSPTAGLVFALALLFSGQSAGIVCTLAGQMVLEGFLTWSFPPVTRRLITRGLAIAPCLIVVSLSGREGLSNVLNFSQVILSILLPIVTAPLILFTCSKDIMKVPIYDINDADFALHDEIPNDNNNKNKGRFEATQPAIKLQDLRNNPCGFDDDENYESRSNNEASTSSSIPLYKPKTKRSHSRQSSNVITPDDSINDLNVKGYKDLSNGPITSFFAILVWGFITSLNLFLIGSLVLGYDVPF